jgi:tripartite ATP-independent transporter DctM subunit
LTTVAACAGFAAIVGDPISVTAAMGATALPEMRKYRYNDYLTSGAITAGSSLGPMIPPSMTFIVYAIITQQSIGKLFIGGIVPGVLLALSFMVVIFAGCRFNPKLGPSGEKATWRERGIVVRAGVPVVILFVLVIGGIYAGIFTAMEGGAIGCVGAIIISLLMRRFNFNILRKALLDAGKVICMVYLILIGAMIFTRFIALCNFSNISTHFLLGLSLPPIAIILIMLFILFILGFVMDTNPLVLIGIPILHPIAISLGYDPLWFTVLAVLVINVGMITPPVGISLFALRAVAPDMPVGTIYRGVFPFVVATIVVVAIILIFPNVATFLPNIIK